MSMFSKIEEASFIDWMRETNQVYIGSEYQLRLGIFISNARLVKAHNLFDKGFKVSMNKFAAMTPSEYKSHLSAIRFQAKIHQSPKENPPSNDSIDWRTKGCVNPIKEQDNCGASWAYSTTQSAEGCYAVKSGTLYNFSEQSLIDCVTECNGCGSGMMTDAFRHIAEKQGGAMMASADYPYVGYQSQCKFDSERAKQIGIKGYQQIASGSEKDLASAVASHGPTALLIDASNWSFQLYRSGIYDEPACSSANLNHAVGCVGYGTENSVNYWIIRNSWGEEWGEQGYIRMVKDKNNQCGEATMACYPTL